MADGGALNINHFVVISGCSGGGKSALIEELARRGFAVVPEPGRRIIAEERVGDGGALPWADPAAFARRAIAMSIADHEAGSGLTFFDRGIVDAAVALHASSGETAATFLALYRYDRVFLAPPWPEIYETDADRRHSLDKALSDYARVERAYRDAGYGTVLLPRDTIVARVDFVLAALDHRPIDE